MEKGEHRPTQCEKVIQYIRDFGSITTLQAMSDLGVLRLASRIFELEEQGYIFDKKWVSSMNRYGEKVNYVMYSLKGEPLC